MVERGIKQRALEELRSSVLDTCSKREKNQELRRKVLDRTRSVLLAKCFDRWLVVVELKTRLECCRGCYFWIPS